MKTKYLLPSRFKKPGWLLFSTGLIILIINVISPIDFEIKTFAVINEENLFQYGWFQFINNNLIDEITLILLIIGGLFVCFAKEKDEDEYIGKLRLESLVWATYVNYAILLLAVIFIYGTAFLNVMIANMFTLIIFFMIRFHWVLYKSRQNLSADEE